MAVVGAVVQQAAQAKEVIAAGFVRQRRILLDEVAVRQIGFLFNVQPDPLKTESYRPDRGLIYFMP